MANNEKFFNFPIGLLNGAFDNISVTMNNIMDYAGYVHAEKLEYGDEAERMKAAGNYFGVTYGNNQQSYNNGEQLFNSLPPNSPMVGINKDVCFDYYKNYKTEFEKVCLLAFLAIKSIVNKKPYCKATNAYLLNRMAGNNIIKDIGLLSNELKRYDNEYQLTKIKKALRDHWGLFHYGRYTRGFYVTFTLSRDELIFQVEKKKKIKY